MVGGRRLLSETRLTAVAQQVMRAQAGAASWQAFWGAPLESRGGGGASWTRRPGGWASWCARAFRPDKYYPPKVAPRTEADTLAHSLWHSTRWCHVLVSLGRGADWLHAQVAYGVSAQPALNRTFWDHATQYMARHGTAPQLVGGDFNFDLDLPPRAPPSVLLGVTSCPPSRTPYTRDLTIFYISTLSMLFDVCDQSCWQSCDTR